MKRTLIYIAFGIFAYGLFLAATIPAELAFGYLKPHAPGFSLEAPRGTPWSGSAATLSIQSHRFEGVEWSLDGTGLLRGEVAYNVTIDDVDVQGSARIATGFDARPYLSKVRARLAARRLTRLFNTAGVIPEGTVHLDLQSLKMDERGIQTAQGTVRWPDASVSSPMQLPLGDFQLNLETSDRGIEGTLGDNGGPLEIDATVVLEPGGRYTIKGTIKPRPSAEPRLAGMVRSMGPASPDGGVRIDFAGHL